MEIEIFTLCDYAQDMKGKFVIVGTFDTIFPKQYPCNHPSCCIALRLRFSEDEQGEHKLELRLIDQKGLVKTPIKGHHSTVNFSLQFNQLKFETPGKYAFELYIDDDWRSGLPLLLTENMPAI